VNLVIEQEEVNELAAPYFSTSLFSQRFKMITKKELDNRLREVLASMEEGEEYILTQEAWDEYNQIRKDRDWHSLDVKDRSIYSFKIKDRQFLFDSRYNDVIVEDIATVTGMTMVTGMAMETAMVTATAMAMALITNQIEKKNKANSLDGKIAEIDGKKYKLQEVK
jgi:hypothetical protein